MRKTCDVCKKSFYIRPSDNAANPDRVCSRSCSFSSPKRKKLLGEHHPLWKGNNAKLEAIHIFVRARKPTDGRCSACKKITRLDLANKTGKYLRDLDDWDYLCRKCHMESDGRLKNFVKNHYVQPQNGRDVECAICNEIFYRTNKRIKKLNYCSYYCMGIARKSLTNDQWKKLQSQEP